MSEVLFVCVHNAGRSQMAAALFNRAASERGLAVRAGSAGTVPADRVHPNVVDSMRELSLDLSEARPALLTDEMVTQAGKVVTMGIAVYGDAHPAILLEDVEDWGLPDPKDASPDQVRVIRDTIAERVSRLLDGWEEGVLPLGVNVLNHRQEASFRTGRVEKKESI